VKDDSEDEFKDAYSDEEEIKEDIKKELEQASVVVVSEEIPKEEEKLPEIDF